MNLIAWTEGIEIQSAGWVLEGSWDVNKSFSLRQGKEQKPIALTADFVAWATFFIGTIVSLALIYSALLLIFAGGDEKQMGRAKDGIKYSLIGLLIVLFSYVIIRAIQYIGTH